MYHFCTYFDHNYLPRGLALYDSLQRHCPSFKLWVLCLSKECHDLLSQLELANIHLILLEDFEKDDEELWQAKQNRTRIEYYFTCTPSLVLYILNKCSEVNMLTYLDADLYFFSDPAPIFKEIGEHSVGIIGHRFPARLQYLEKLGIYNVGWVSFKRDENGLVCLHWWREKCIEWCYDRYEVSRFADQNYLDEWPNYFADVIVIQHKGAGVAPWNIDGHNIQTNKGKVLIDGCPLIFFHFH